METNSQVQFDLARLGELYESDQLERAPTAVEDPITGVRYRDVNIDVDTSVSARLFLPRTHENKKLPVLIYFHGGGFDQGSAYSRLHHNYLISLASQANVLAVSVDYRLAPAHLLPAAYDDSWTAFTWVLSRADPWLAKHGDFDRVFVAGESAGANITHNLTARLGAEVGVRIEGMVLLHPFFWGSKPVESETTVPWLRHQLDQMWVRVKSTDMSLDDPRINPAAEGAPSLAGLGCERAMVFLAEKDPWLHRGRAYLRALADSGWDGEERVFESEGRRAEHAFFLARPETAEALEVMEKFVAFIIENV